MSRNTAPQAALSADPSGTCRFPVAGQYGPHDASAGDAGDNGLLSLPLSVVQIDLSPPSRPQTPMIPPHPSPTIECISAVTLVIRDMQRTVGFYRSLGFSIRYGGAEASFTSLVAGPAYLNLITQPAYQPRSQWGRIIFYVSDVDAMYDRVVELGLQPGAPPRDAEWGERYFHLADPDGHQLSFAMRLDANTTGPDPSGD